MIEVALEESFVDEVAKYFTPNSGELLLAIKLPIRRLDIVEANLETIFERFATISCDVFYV